MKYILLFIGLNLLIFNSSGQKLKSVAKSDSVDFPLLQYKQIDFEDNDSFQTFGILDSVLGNYKYFFVGENHQFRYSNSKMELKFLKYLNQNAGVNTLVLEFGFSRGYLINKYINDQNDTSLFQILNDYSYQEYADFYRDLRKYNISLPVEKRIKVVGLDVERFENMPARLLTMLIPVGKSYHDSLALSIESLQGIGSYLDSYSKAQKSRYKKDKEEDENKDESDNDRYINFSGRSFNTLETLKDIIADFDRKDSLVREYFGENYEIYRVVANEIKDMIVYRNYYNQTQQYVYREQYMFNKLKKYLAENPQAKIFGQFGRCHVSTKLQKEACDWYEYKSLVHRINSHKNFENKVLSIGVFYPKDELINQDLKKFSNLTRALNQCKFDSTAIISTNNDTSLFDEFANSYQFIIVNNINLNSEKKNLTEVDNAYGDYYEGSPTGLHFDYSFGQRTFNFKSLNSSLNSLNYPSLKSSIFSHRFGYTIETERIYAGYSFEYFTPQQVKNTIDTSLAKFNGFVMEVNFGYDIIENEWFTIKPNLGLGYGQLKLVQKKEDENSLNENGFSNSYITKSYINPAFTFQPGLDLALNLKFFSIGLSGTYLFDFSKKSWKNSENLLLSESPKTSLSSYYIGLYFGMYF